MRITVTSVFIQLDRHAALVRAVWRLLAAALIGGLAASIAARIEWAEHWRGQRIVGLSLAFILTVIALPAIGLTYSALRWILAAAAANAGIELNDAALVVRAGPFGSQAFDWPRLRIEIGGDLPPETWALLPDDAISIALTHPAFPGDLFDRIRVLLGARTPLFVRSLRERVTASAESTI